MKADTSASATVAGVGTPAVTVPRPLHDPGAMRELRLALVCYGGVSLAIYMHGVTKEIHRLVLASAALDLGLEENPFDARDTAGVYWDLLGRLRRRRAAANDDAVTRVVVDIVSGASAGGINGVFLAKALAENRSQDALRQVWFERGDVKQLLRGWKRLPVWFRAAWWIPKSIRGLLKVKPPLRGDEMCTWLHDALEGMDTSPRPLEGLTSLVPDDQVLSLHVPVTDFHGYPIEIPLDDPRLIRDRSHRHIMEFVHDGSERRQFAPQENHGLAFTARATSSFPGAFPPVTIDDYESAVGGARLDNAWDRLFPRHRLAGIDPRRAFFIDGGVLDNFPFATSIQAIKARHAWTEVDRRLVFIEPDPATEAAGTSHGTAPSWYATIFGGYAGIPRKEPIADDLFALGDRNATVRTIRDIIEAGFDSMRDRVAELVGGERELLEVGRSPSEIGGDRVRAEEIAGDRAGFAYTTYLRLRISGVIDQYAVLVSQVRSLPERSAQGQFVADVLRTWAREVGLFAKEPQPTKEQREFLAHLDLSFHERRIRFLIAAVNWWYNKVGEEGFPTRAELDEAKRRLYQRLRPLSRIASQLASDADIAAVRLDFLVRYLGFPFWDILVHPVAALSDVNERDEVEVMRISPLERRLLLRSDGTRDPLIGARWGHFGAFFSRKGRQHDYLWGRFDAAERLIALLLDDPGHPGVSPPDPKECRKAFEAILAEESAALDDARPVLEDLSGRVRAL